MDGRTMEQLQEKVSRHLTLPELLDLLDVDYEELEDTTLLDFFRERESDIRELLKDYGD